MRGGDQKRRYRNKPGSVYIHFGRNEELLYIGRTSRLLVRQNEHSLTKPWWRDIQRIGVIHCSSERAAANLEVRLIECFRPRHNKQHNVVRVDKAERDAEELYVELLRAREIRPLLASEERTFQRLQREFPKRGMQRQLDKARALNDAARGA